MPKCGRCFGSGTESYVEDNREFNDVCYHCAGSGVIDDDLAYHDYLHDVAATLAYYYEKERRNAINEEAEEPYYFWAAENGMTEHDYFRAMMYEREYEIADRLLKLPVEMQKILIEWNQYNV